MQKIIITLIFWMHTLYLFSAISPNEIVKKADMVRAPSKPFSIITEIYYYKKGNLSTKQVVKVYIKDRANSIVKFLKPAKMKGRVLLMSGDNVWIQVPGSRNPIRLTPQQRLLGQASNGDIARMNYVGDYNASLIKIQKIKNKEYYVLKLTAKRRGVTYQRIKYFVEKETFRPYQALFYAKTGKILKKATFAGFQQMAGDLRPTKVIIYDMIKKNEYTILKYRNIMFKSLPAYYFQKNYLKRIR